MPLFFLCHMNANVSLILFVAMMMTDFVKYHVLGCQQPVIVS